MRGSKSQNTDQQSVNAKTLKTLSQEMRKETLSLSTSPLAITLKSLKEKKPMSKIFYNMAKKNYPALWNREMVDHFHEIGRLTDEEYRDVIGDDGGDE